MSVDYIVRKKTTQDAKAVCSIVQNILYRAKTKLMDLRRVVVVGKCKLLSEQLTSSYCIVN